MAVLGIVPTVQAQGLPTPPTNCSGTLSSAEIDAVTQNWAYAVDTGTYSSAWETCLNSLTDSNVLLMEAQLDVLEWEAPAGTLDDTPPEILLFEAGSNGSHSSPATYSDFAVPVW